MHAIDMSLVDWSRAQFALTAMYHWLFVPLTLGLGLIISVMASMYYKTGETFWKQTTKFWMKLFGINFAVGVATGLILEFEFGTNWSNYSWIVGDIFGAPLAIEGILAFFMEATFIAVMFFGWDKVSKKFHLASFWLTWIGASISALWILVANAWMQNPVGMEFNPDTVRFEMNDFWAVISPLAINKFFHSILAGWMVGGAFVVGISCWFMLKKRNEKFAVESAKIGAIVGIVGVMLSAITGHESGYQVAQKQPMKLAAMEALYEGEAGAGLVVVDILNPKKKSYDDGVDPLLLNFKMPKMLSFLASYDFNAFVPGIKDLIDGGYQTPDGQTALSANEKIEKGKAALQALSNYKAAKKGNDDIQAEIHRKSLMANIDYFGYGYITDVNQLIPNVGLTFYSFRFMVIFGMLFILLFLIVLFYVYKKDITKSRWLQWVCLISIPFAYLTSQAGWIVAEVGRQPWTIQDILPTFAAVSRISTSSVQITFFLFLLIFTALLIAEVRIMIKQIKKGPNT